MKERFATIVFLASVLSACGTVTRGTTENVVIKSLPEDAQITTSISMSCPRSPCALEVPRKKAFTAYASRDGYKPGSILIQRKVSGGGAAGFAGNILIGGVVGMGVDAVTGASLDHYPNPALIVLEPVDPKDPATPVMKPPAPAPKKKASSPST